MARPDISLPVSLPASDPDYTRERYSVGQAAAYLCASTKLVYTLAASGRLAHRRDGRGRTNRLLFSQADLDGYRATSRIESHRSAESIASTAASSTLRPVPVPSRRRFQ